MSHTQRHWPITCIVVAMLAAYSASHGTTSYAADIEPLLVDIDLHGKWTGNGDGACEGGDWSLSWRGELPGEGRNVHDLLISYSAFDTTLEDDRVDPKPAFNYTPLVCRDIHGNVTVRSTMSGGAPTVRGTLAIKQDAAFRSPFFVFDAENLGTCRQKTATLTNNIPNVTIAVSTQQMTTIAPTLAFSEQDMRDGFSKTYRLGGMVVATDGFACMSTVIDEGHLTLAYKRKRTKPHVEMSGCVHLARGAATQVQTQTSPAGGALSFTSDPIETLAIHPNGGSATVTGATPGRATLTAHYTLNGETATASLPGSSTELLSVNNGAPLPTLGLYDVDGKPSSKVYSFPIETNPADAGDLLSFTTANDALVSVVNGTATIGLQPVREGRTTIQGTTACGAPIGKPFEVVIAMCDADVHAQLERKRAELQLREQTLVKRITQLTGDSEFQRAGSEIKQDTIDIATKTGELIAGTLTAGESMAAKNGVQSAVLNAQQLETAGTLWDGFNVAQDAARGDWNKAMVGAFVMKLGKWQVSLAKTAWESKQAAEKFGQDLGTLVGVAEQLDELEPQQDKVRQELYVIIDRLHRCDKLPPPSPPTSKPPKKHRPPPKHQPTPQPTPQTPEPTEPPPTTDVPPLETPPTPPTGPVDPTAPPTSGGLCVRRISDLPTTTELRNVVAEVNAYSQTLAQTQNAVANAHDLVAAFTAANALDGAARTDALHALAPRYQAFVQQFYTLADASRAHAQHFNLCTDTLPDWVKEIKTRY